MRQLLLCLALAAALPVQADSYTWGKKQFEYDYDEEKKPWEEIQAQMPAAPKAEALMPFTLDATATGKYYIDGNSLSVGEDGVVRYTVVIVSAQGARTVNFEGMRCTTGERKIYAFGRPNGEWARNRYPRWEPINARQQSSYHRELFFSYFCAGGEGLPDLARIQYRLKTGGYRPPQ
ncbi:CNP1-like family protein [Sulfuritortus calidifontis]|uniref:CNP1-like family protein n=1 Tax=Sulfuritortus calidifontis TaxID=1914471 RepID=A0A4R3JYT6_9PROT|nr:CNP1-like family protein [Sulfuritortus calidifontis]TCS73948.1 CNP1-like family protein [Sulfuritortus calidifontis]